MITDAYVKALQEQVTEKAREICQFEPKFPGMWKLALEQAAKELCEGWEWKIMEYYSNDFENAYFFLTMYVGIER